MTLVADTRTAPADLTGFRFAPGVREALPAFRTRCTVVRLASLDNEHLGVPRWYTLAEAWTDLGTAEEALWSGNPVIDVDSDDPAEPVLATGAPVIVLGAGLGVIPWQRDVVDAVRALGARVLVVEMGPVVMPGYADIATGGYARAHGARLVSLLCGGDAG
jgi:glycosyltransferase involved in cell wall biosynthesis